jgi:hypothetical protein
MLFQIARFLRGHLPGCRMFPHLINTGIYGDFGFVAGIALFAFWIQSEELDCSALYCAVCFSHRLGDFPQSHRYERFLGMR